MKYLMSAEWWKAAGIRAAKTMFQTGAALVVTQMPGGTVDWHGGRQCSDRGKVVRDTLRLSHGLEPV